MADKVSPFTPGSPVPVELFVGRGQIISGVRRCIGEVKIGKQKNAFLVGQRGIGKSSCASFIRYLVSTNDNILAVHVFLGRVDTVDELVRCVLEKIYKESRTQTWFSKIKGLFGEYITEVGLMGVSITFSPPKENLKELVNNFSAVLDNVIQNIRDEKSGLLIILDDINGLAEKSEFANWYKSFVDEVATRGKEFPVYIMLIGLPDRMDALAKIQPSLMRIFRVIEIEKLTDEEVKDFYQKAFGKVGIKINLDAMGLMVKYSSGLPILMHEIGDAIFWLVEDNTITKENAIDGIFLAADNVGKKYLDPKVYRTLRSERYKSILKKFGESSTESHFTKKEMEKKLSESEKRVLHNFLRRLKELNIIESDLDGGLGDYRFVNEIYPLYILMQSRK